MSFDTDLQPGGRHTPKANNHYLACSFCLLHGVHLNTENKKQTEGLEST